MDALTISPLHTAAGGVEIVERKGLGHPDTICDALAETLSRNLSRAYRERFGQVLHHNVDKALLVGGRSAPAFRGGTVIAPIRIYLAGRAVAEVGEQSIKIQDIAVEGSRAWLRANLHALDPEHHVEIRALAQPGSQDLRELFAHRPGTDAPLANDSSIGVGYAPMSTLERLVLAVEQRMNGRDRHHEHRAWGEDVKVLGVCRAGTVQLTIACAMIGGHLMQMDDYLVEKNAIKTFARQLAAEHGFADCSVSVNAADDPAAGAIYLTVTGTSAEAGDDGQVGRGNRANGLITPCRPMSLEAAAGKNPVSHVGKIYNVVARQIAETLVATLPQIEAAECLMVSRIGAPVATPAVLDVRLLTRDALPLDPLKPAIEAIAAERLASMPRLIDEFLMGTITVF